MTSNELLIIGAAVLVVLAFLLFVVTRRRGQAASAAERHEGQGVADEGAAAIENVVGEFLGVDAHPDAAAPGAGVRRMPSGHAPQTIAAEPADLPPAAPAPEPGIADAAATALENVADQFLGIDAAPDLPADDLTMLKGLGPKAAGVLNGLGITRFAQLAALDDAQVAALDAQLGAFRGRILRDRWVEQARYLAAGDRAGFEAIFGRLG